jgi:EmrB/QacA subfamily drug resistance transporter
VIAARVPVESGAAPAGGTVGRWVLAATILGSSMAFIDGTVVNVALPTIQEDLGATQAGVQWVVQSYALFLAALLLVGGSLGDHFGRRRIFALGVALFTLASVGCGLAGSIGQLIAARAVQGVGGAMLVPGSLAIISASFPNGAERGRAIGTWSGFTSITTAIGPVLGGWLVEHASWRWVFFLNLPLAAVVLAITLRRVPESRDPEATGGIRGIDWWGALLATVGLGALTYGLTAAATRGWGDSIVLATLALGVGALLAFVAVEARGRAPMMPLGLFRSRTFSGANLLTFLLYGALGGTLFFFPFNLIQVQGYSPTAAGAAFLPMILIMFALSRWAGGLIGRYGAKPPLIVGPTIAAVGFALFAVPGIGGSYWTTFFPAVVVLGVGMAVTVAPLTTAVMGAVEDRHAGLASGVNNAVSRVAGLLAIAALGIVVAATFRSGLDQRLDDLGLAPTARAEVEAQRDRLAAAEPPAGVDKATAEAVTRAIDEAFVGGFRVVMLLGAALALASALITGLMIEGKADQPADRRARRTDAARAPPKPGSARANQAIGTEPRP